MVRRTLGVALILGALLLAFPSSVFAAEGDQKITVNLVQAALIGFGYYLSQGPWLFGMGFFTLYRPLVAGLFVGIILGDPGQGTLIGAAINLIYLGFISAGGSIPGDPALAGWVATTLALAGGLSVGAALALAVPIGLLGTVIWNARMTGDTVFVHYADRKAEEANIGEVARSNWLYPQVYLFLITFVPVFLAANFGVTFVTDIINGLPTWVLNGLAVGGGILPAIGIAMNMRFIFRFPVVPYFFLGYFLFVVTQVVTGVTISMAVIAVIGLAAAALHVFYVGDRDQGAALRAAAASK
jgi:mannose/fructose/N-acetylgalactosamine-specific phosphotransferase system component IIC